MTINWNNKDAIIRILRNMKEEKERILKSDDPERIEKSIEMDGSWDSFIHDCLENIPAKFCRDRDFLLALIPYDSTFYRLAEGGLEYDPDILLAAISGNSHDYKEWRGDFCCNSLPLRILENIPPFVFDDREFVLKCVTLKGRTLEYMPERYKEDSEIVTAAMKQDPFALRYASRDIHLDRNLVFDALHRNGNLLAYIPYEYENDIDRDTVLKGVAQNGWDLEYVPEIFRNDPEIVRAAVKENPYSFRVASEQVRNNEELTLEMIRKYNVPLNEINKELWKRPSFVLEAVKLFGTSVLYKVDWKIPAFNEAFAIELLGVDPVCFGSLPEKLRESETVRKVMEEAAAVLEAKAGEKSDIETSLDEEWDKFLDKLLRKSEMAVPEFLGLFFDTFWYFRNRTDTASLRKSGWHILSSLSALVKLPYDFFPSGCTGNEYNAARCLAEDLLDEIANDMPGFYTGDCFVMERGCMPLAGCSEDSANMKFRETFESDFYSVVRDFDDGFSAWRYENYSGRYNF